MLYLTTVLFLVALVSAENAEFEENGLKGAESDDGKLGIIGGQMAEEGQFPFTAALYIEDQFICTSSIISESTILTAGHCVSDDNGKQQPASSFTAYIGNVNRSSPDATQIFFRKVTLHPGYNSNLKNDIAMLEITNPINFTKNIQPICIAGSKFPKLVSKTVTAMGWGQDSREEQSSPEILRFVKQRVISNFKCKLFYLGKDFPETTLCARGLASGVCFGDSGGPLVYQKNSRNPMVQVGIASFVNSLTGCGTVLGPAGFTRVSSYNDFIMNTATGKVCVV